MQTTYPRTGLHSDFLQANLAELREKAFSRVVRLMGIAAYILVTWSLWPNGTPVPARLVWGLLGCGLILACVLSHWLARQRLGIGSLVLMSGLTACISVALLILRSADILYLFILPISFAGILLDEMAGIIVTVFALTLAAFAILFGVVPELLPVSLLALVLAAGANLIVISNLYTALTWALLGYDSARRNQDIARERKGELEQTLSSLSITTNTLYRTNEALEFARRQADEARKIKQNFAQMISHELRTPLNLIVGFTETMIKSPETYGVPLAPRYLRDLSVVYRNACHLQSLVNDVLDLARIDAAQMSLQVEQTALAEIVDDMIITARGLVEAQHLIFNAKIESNLPFVWVDPIRIRQVIYNLLNNAARYTSQGEIDLRVHSCTDKPGWVEFAVSDTGIGIPPDQLQRIFEPFQQVLVQGQARKGGVGLGLTISQDLARMHGGYIHVESTLGVGSTFYFRFPVRPPPLDLLHGSILPAVSQRLEPLDKVVLLVTRSLSAASMVSRHLQGCRTIVVSNLLQGKSIIQQVIPQMVIVDTLDLDTDPEAVSAQISGWGLSNTYLILCPLPGEELLRQQFGVYGYLIKPVAQNTLWDTLRPLGDAVQTVLVVDDDQNFTRLIERMLDNRLRRYRVLHAHSGQEAIEIAHQQSPHVILLDLELPDIDGLQVIERLRANERSASIRIIVVSGNDLNWSMSLSGHMTVFRSSGMTSTDVVNWIAGLANTCLL